MSLFGVTPSVSTVHVTAVLVVMVAGCGGQSSTTGPQPGTLEVVTSTGGSEVDPDGYTVSLDDGAGRAVGTDDTVVFADRSAGDHSVQLSGVASNCSVGGSNPRTVSVPEGDTATTTFDVTCEADGGGGGDGGERSAVAVPAASDWSGPTQVLSPGPSGAWDSRFAGPAPATVVKKDGTYHLYYVGAAGDRSSDGGPANRAVGLATSTDGSTWTKHPDNPVVSWDDLQNNSHEEEGAWGMAAYVDGDEVILYVADLVGSGGNVNGDIRLFTSTDGVNFSDQGIVLDHSSSFPGDDEVTPVGVYEDAGGTWHLYYVAKGGGTFWDLAHASGPSRDDFTSAEVVRADNSEGDNFRYGGDVVVLRDDSSGVRIGTMIGGANEGDHEYYSFEDTDFTADTFEAQYPWGSEGAAHYLDRSTSTWLAFHNDGSDDNSGIYLRTAPVHIP